MPGKRHVTAIGKKFDSCVRQVSRKGGAYDPKAVCAAQLNESHPGALQRASAAARRAKAGGRRANPALLPGDPESLGWHVFTLVDRLGLDDNVWYVTRPWVQEDGAVLGVTAGELAARVRAERADPRGRPGPLATALGRIGRRHGYRFVPTDRGDLRFERIAAARRRANPSPAAGYRCRRCGNTTFLRHHTRYLCTACYEEAPRGKRAVRANPSSCGCGCNGAPGGCGSKPKTPRARRSR